MSFQKLKTISIVALVRLIAKLPLSSVLAMGSFLGYITWILPNKRKKIAARNLTLCFPHLSKQRKKQLLKNNLISTGTGFAEMVVALWKRSIKSKNRVKFYGIEHVHNALKNNNGCILLSCHLHSIEISIRLINQELKNKGHMLARQHNNKILEKYIDEARRLHCEKTIDKKDVRTVLKSLKNNNPVYYVPDQNFSYQCEFIDFFGQPAATVVAPVRLAQVSQSPVIPWFGFRGKDERGKTCWKIHFFDSLDYFYSSDIKSSLKKMNKLFEHQITKHPEQYLWVHRRFKNHPEGKNFLYRNL